MTDLHTHILPDMDDGSSSVQESIELLKMEYEQGIRNVVLTSHFNCEKTSVEEFIKKRTLAYEKLLVSLDKQLSQMNLKLGCEVFFSPWLAELNLMKLCAENTNVLLIELPSTYQPPFLEELLFQFRTKGIITVIAHVERYPYAVNRKCIIEKWIQNGAIIQMNASALFNGFLLKKKALKLIKEGYVHVIASDAHSVISRPPLLEEAFNMIEKKLGRNTVISLKENADKLFEGKYYGEGYL